MSSFTATLSVAVAVETSIGGLILSWAKSEVVVLRQAATLSRVVLDRVFMVIQSFS